MSPARLLRLLAGPAALLLTAACATAPQSRVEPEPYLADITWLADDARGGRDTGSPELFATAEFVAERFQAAGLEPAGDNGTYLQHFTVKGARTLLEGNALVIGGNSFDLAAEFMPLQTALTGSARGPAVFAGYGIVDVEGGRDDYSGLDVKDKVVLVLRRGPRSQEPGTRYAEGGRGREQAGFVSKVNSAFKRGAAGLIVINDPLSCQPDTADDNLPGYRSLRGEGVGASLPAARLTAKAGLEVFSAQQLDLRDVQRSLDAGGAAPALIGVTADLEVRSGLSEVDTVNVLGYLPGQDAALEGEYVLIGAHMDHVGRGMHAASRGGREAVGQIHNGADDNASGTAAVIELADVLGEQRDGLRRGVMFATWSGEEWGLLGSQHYTEQPARPLDDLVAAINMDMIGRGKDGYVIVEGMGTSPGFRNLIVAAHDALGLQLDLRLADKPSDNSDHASFLNRRIPVVNFFTGLHDDYHMPSDDIARINAQGGADIASLAGQTAVLLANADARPLFTDASGSTGAPGAAVAAGPADPHAAPGGPGAPGGGSGPRDGAPQAYRVVLGTSPDMSYQEEDGVRLSSVRAGTPAERAGLKPGDVITAFDGQVVRNLEDYSVLLFRHKPGDEVTVTVRRGAETLNLKAVLTGPTAEG